MADYADVVLAQLQYKDLSDPMQPIGQGKFGKVHKAFCRILDQDVAVKIITDRNIFKKEEIDILVKSSAHDNVVNVKAVIIPKLEGEKYWIVMEFCDYNLQQIRDKISDKPIPWARWTFLIKDILAGLNYLHYKKFVHCDLKPENVLVNDRFKAKIGDVGLSRIAGEHYTACENQTLVLPSGTLQYISPERLRDPYKAPQFTDDCYSCGLLIYKMITNADLFNLKDTHDEHTRITSMKFWLSGDDPYRHPLEDLANFHAPQEIETAIAILWDKNHDNRSAEKAKEMVDEAVTKHGYDRKETLEKADKFLKNLMDGKDLPDVGKLDSPEGNLDEGAGGDRSSIPDERINQPEALVTDKDLNKIASEIGPEWKKLGLSLGLSKAQLFQREADNPHTVHDKIFAMLRKWKLREQRNATRSVLINELATTGSVDPSAFDFMLKT